MRKTKYVLNSGLAFSESGDLAKLSKLAKKGWLLEGISYGGFCFRLVRTEPADVEYSLDYRANVSEDYFELFEAAGWSHVVSVENIHIFRAPTGTKAIYSDEETMTEKYDEQRRLFGKYAVWALVPVVLLFLVLMIWDAGSGGVWWNVMLGLFMIAAVALVFTGMPYLAFMYRLWKLQK
ncbi:hypothetical protein BKP35_04820 [Anaerobacillus arseniciselenatis]|uniref:DUF2812 domain-containing protein n=1 Tax=Anaerobacillus arseniciselenatis TaxID=85682 RepID=A0A1S2LS16_9BACI|nr:DUF2812 domain-containing protein [Anaerobacillus arseniciselenatis]OIJ15176.1 hypothetical protein BKP35_04820 [Anaerobacillus arseniciselenatis]